MKRILLILGLVLSAYLGVQAQGVTSIELQPVCWNFNNQDSSLTAYWLMSSREVVPRVVSYLNPATGAQVDISGGGTVSAGYCCCATSGGSGTTVTVTDNADGTYTIISGTDTTLVDTRADSNPVAINITVGDTIFLAGSTVQEIINQIATEVNTTKSRTGCDLKIGQASHGFDEGDLLAQDSTTGVYYLSSSDSTHNWPVAYVCQVVNSDTFLVDTEGWLAGPHGFTPYRDYYNQDGGGVGFSPGTIQQFAFRTFTDNLLYIDLPEYAVEGAGGSGDNWGSQVVQTDATITGDGTPSSPLGIIYDQDWLKAGGSYPGNIPFSVNDNIYTEGLVAIGSVPRPHRFFVFVDGGTTTNDVRFGDSNKENDLNFTKDISGIWMKNGNTFASNYAAIRFLGSAGSSAPTNGSLSFYSDGTLTMRNLGGQLILDNVPNYLDDAAADADANFPVGGVYTISSDNRALRIKR